MLAIPLVYFLIQYQPLFLRVFSTLLSSQPILFSTFYTLIFAISKPIGGILFGKAFWVIARKLGGNNVVGGYMIISGLVLVFVSNQAVILATAPYPPVGLATASFMGLASYLVLVGIYSSALSLAEDSKLRQSIRSITIKESKLLDSVGTAHMEQEIHRRVMYVTKQSQKMTEETGIQSSLTEDDIKQYLEQVIREVKMQKNSPGRTNRDTLV